jgi:hypothetical protein
MPAAAAWSGAVVIIPAAQKTDHGTSVSRQYAGSLFEQVLFVATKAIFQSLWDNDTQPAEELWLRHANPRIATRLLLQTTAIYRKKTSIVKLQSAIDLLTTEAALVLAGKVAQGRRC